MILLIRVTLATFEVEPIIIFLPEAAINVTILEIVTVLPLPGGPLIKVIAFSNDFLIA